MKMIFRRFGAASKFAFIGTFLLSANHAWGATAACNQSAPTVLSGLNTAAGFGLYCIENDKTFSNFALSGTGVAGGVTQTTATADVQGSTSFGSETLNTQWTVTNQFAGVTAADFQATSNSGTQAVTTGTLTYLATSAPTTVNTPALGYPAPQSGAANYITNIELATAGVTGNSNRNGDNSMLVTETFCIGTAACTNAVGAGNEVILTATYGNNDTTPTYTCALGSNATAARAGIVASTCSATGVGTPYNVQFAFDVTQVNITDVYTLNANRTTLFAQTTSTLTDFQNVFTEEELAPEPSTFILLGSALVGLGAIHLRKRKQA